MRPAKVQPSIAATEMTALSTNAPSRAVRTFQQPVRLAMMDWFARRETPVDGECTGDNKLCMCPHILHIGFEVDLDSAG